MRVLFDISALGAVAANAHQRHIFGVARVVEKTLAALVEADSEVEQLFVHARYCIAGSERYYRSHWSGKSRAERYTMAFVPPAIPVPVRSRLLELEAFFSSAYVRAPWKTMGVGRAGWWATRRILDRVTPSLSSSLDIYHCPFGAVPKWTGFQRKLRRFTTIYDLIPTLQPQHFYKSTVRAADRALSALTYEDWTLSISESTRRDLLEHFPQLDPEKAAVTQLAADPHFMPQFDSAAIATARARYGIPEGEYFLSLCTVEPRKNVDVIIRAFVRFYKEQKLKKDVSLVLVGKVIERTPQLQAALESAGSLCDRIIFTGFVADEDLSFIYSGAQAFVYMSQYEGFGLPPLEAMQCGVPVIASDVSSIPEVVHDAGILLDPFDIDALSAAMGQLWNDQELRAALSKRGIQRAKLFSWERFSKQTLGAYRRAVAA
jgi:glycosyltransferase involved in cell wall biosynthesis